MADETSNTSPNGNGADTAPQAAALAQYVKDLSVESPNSPQCFQWQVQPQVDVQFNIAHDKVADDVYELVLKISVNAKSDQGAHFLVDVSYAGLFGLRNLPEDQLAAFLLVEAPRLLFPFARQIIADAVQHVGFPPLLLEPIDFGQVFMQQVEAAQAVEGGNPAEAASDEPTPTEQ